MQQGRPRKLARQHDQVLEILRIASLERGNCARHDLHTCFFLLVFLAGASALLWSSISLLPFFWRSISSSSKSPSCLFRRLFLGGIASNPFCYPREMEAEYYASISRRRPWDLADKHNQKLREPCRDRLTALLNMRAHADGVLWAWNERVIDYIIPATPG